MLAGLAVASETSTAYDRDALFGGDWIDADSNGCDTRSEVLLAEAVVAATVGAGCTVQAGSWVSYYDGVEWQDPGRLDIDHVVPLKEAWDSGASARGWSEARRLAYANDLDFAWSLEAVTDTVNQSKGDRDPAEGLPGASQEARCTYATRWVAVKYRWDLTIDPAERTILADILSGECGSRVSGVPAKG